MTNRLDLRKRKDGMIDPRKVEDTGTAGPCIHCGHLRSGVDGKNQCLLCVTYIFLKEDGHVLNIVVK